MDMVLSKVEPLRVLGISEGSVVCFAAALALIQISRRCEAVRKMEPRYGSICVEAAFRNTDVVPIPRVSIETADKVLRQFRRSQIIVRLE